MNIPKLAKSFLIDKNKLIFQNSQSDKSGKVSFWSNKDGHRRLRGRALRQSKIEQKSSRVLDPIRIGWIEVQQSFSVRRLHVVYASALGNLPL